MEKEVLVIIYRRRKIASDSTTEGYIYEPIEIKQGKEYIEKGTKMFIDNKKIDYPFIEDISSLDEDFVYAFPIYLDNLSKGKRDVIKKNIRENIEGFDKYQLYQIYTIDSGNITTLASNDELETQITVNPDNYKEFILKIKNNSYLGKVKDLKEQISTVEKEIQSRKTSQIIQAPKIIYADELYDSVRSTVICQDDQIKQIATTVAKNQRIPIAELKSNMLICGPTGVGKTEIFRTIRKKTDIPIIIEDSTEYTAASFKGKDVNEMLLHLYESANKDLEKAQTGIIVVDEIDKKVADQSHATYTSAVIESLLKMMEGHTYIITSPDDKETIEFDTSKLTFAFLGAFSGIEKYSKTKTGIGFNSQPPITQNNQDIFNNETLKKYGMLPEFLGRNDNIIVMNNLGIEEYMKIIETSDKSQLLLYKKFFESIGIKFIYEKDTVEEIAKEAKKLGIGARGIKRIVENALVVANYYALSKSQNKELIITPETIHDNKKFILR